MGKQTKGKCKYCGKEYTKSYMLRHLESCKERKIRLDTETGNRSCGYFELAIYGRYDKAYWLIIEISEDATLEDLDIFLRDIWLECCGHLSAFEIDGINYESHPVDNFFWGRQAENMRCKLKNVLYEEAQIGYEYDFGSTTALIIDVCGYRKGVKGKEKLTILSRNNPLVFICDECNVNEATVICAECIYDGAGLLCDKCRKTHECGEDMQLPVCNSPRMGVCGYEGSDIYPDEFVPDCEAN